MLAKGTIALQKRDNELIQYSFKKEDYCLTFIIKLTK